MKREDKIDMQKKVFDLSTKTIVTIGIGAALYGALGFVGIPIGPNTNLKPAIAILAIFAAMFGPVVGFLVGFIGHLLTDMIAGWGIWWGWVASSGIMGAFMGLVWLYKGFSVKDGIVNKGHIIYFTIMSIVGIIVSLVFAAGIDVFLMGEPGDKVLVQVVASTIANTAVVTILGIPVILGLAKKNKNNTNLKLDK